MTFVLYGLGVLMINYPYLEQFFLTKKKSRYGRKERIYRGFEDPERPRSSRGNGLSSETFSTV
jgi:hypothetical protein